MSTTLTLLETLSQLTVDIAQLNQFIDQFYQVVQSADVHFITDADNSVHMVAPGNMPDDEMNQAATRLRIIDRLILTRNDEIQAVFDRT